MLKESEFIVTYCKDKAALEFVREKLSEKLLPSESIKVYPTQGDMFALVASWTFCPFTAERKIEIKAWAEGFKCGMRYREVVAKNKS